MFDASKGTVVWGMNHFKQFGLTSLLDDLVEVEDKGFDNKVCDQVRKALDKISNSFTDIPDNLLFRRAIYSRMEDFTKSYLDWNNIDGSEEKSKKIRVNSMRVIRKKRHLLANQIRKNVHIINENLDLKTIDSIYTALGDLAKAVPNIFIKLADAVLSYFANK
jgi:hypothetical protein